MAVRGINQDEHKLLEEQPLNLIPWGEEIKEYRTYSGLIIPMPDGNKRFIQASPMSGLVFGLWRKQLHAKVFQVSGDMIFNLDEDTYKEFDR